MRDPNRIDNYMETLTKLWKKYPDMRLGQFLLNVLQQYRADHSGRDAFYVEDKEFDKYLKSFLGENK